MKVATKSPPLNKKSLNLVTFLFRIIPRNSKKPSDSDENTVDARAGVS